MTEKICAWSADRDDTHPSTTIADAILNKLRAVEKSEKSLADSMRMTLYGFSLDTDGPLRYTLEATEHIVVLDTEAALLDWQVLNA